jgi:hypothetical protein
MIKIDEKLPVRNVLICVQTQENMLVLSSEFVVLNQVIHTVHTGPHLFIAGIKSAQRCLTRFLTGVLLLEPAFR